MTTLLHISASPRGEASHSLAIARTFVESFAEVSPEASVSHWDLWDGSLPAFGPDGAGAKMRVFAGDEPKGAEEIAWHRARLAFERFAAADLYLFSLPMWNSGVPYIAKQFIDVVSQPGWVFGFDGETGYSGLLEGKRAAVVYSSAVYGEGRPPAFGADFQQPFFEGWLRWAGIDEIDSIEFRPNLAIADAEPGRLAAHAEARRLGAEFGRDARAAAA
ncbi:NAD(P)H-dependent oxidoreductase [Agromyces endophyticus]|uniref:FMN-dependent NADH-azoreductase n=1 Tax=Agromyces sp. H17E-10 TaxID=2932244 RepID=UPI001FD5B83F|nr:NAD(P)H-dependent oxidoreductase [Agromyces sp. H17E-10]UOQ90149.1 NAD(P)H-dependent oxidoreductase [Agromyces sp. H17E-10]